MTTARWPTKSANDVGVRSPTFTTGYGRPDDTGSAAANVIPIPPQMGMSGTSGALTRLSVPDPSVARPASLLTRHCWFGAAPTRRTGQRLSSPGSAMRSAAGHRGRGTGGFRSKMVTFSVRTPELIRQCLRQRFGVAQKASRSLRSNHPDSFRTGNPGSHQEPYPERPGPPTAR
jgi:hypothetical protein